MRTRQWTLDGASQSLSVSAGLLAGSGRFLLDAWGERPTLVVSDSHVAPLYAEELVAGLRAAQVPVELEVVPAGEASKSLETAATLFQRLADLRLGRDGAIVALGGGVVSDLAGFVAATWLRGIRWAVCPTTLEGAIDAAIGGKTGINLAAGKNLVGAFHPASHVLVDPGCLRTLERRDLAAGMAESIKHALISDAAFLDWQQSRRDAILACDPLVMEELIERNAIIKMECVSGDFRELTGGRARLNFGHTLGHAIEAGRGYALRHGECVALGMLAAAHISQSLGLLDAASCARVEGAIRDFGLLARCADMPDADELLAFISRDKKVQASRVRWVLLEAVGRTVIRDDVPPDFVRSAIHALR